jgi:hypothetical protein
VLVDRTSNPAQGSFPQSEKIIGIKIGEVGLRLCAGGGVYASKGLDLVILPDVFAAVQGRWRRRTELRGVSNSEGSNGAQPWRRHVGKARKRGTPVAGVSVAGEVRRGVREAPVAGPQAENVCGGLMAYGQARVLGARGR